MIFKVDRIHNESPRPSSRICGKLLRSLVSQSCGTINNNKILKTKNNSIEVGRSKIIIDDLPNPHKTPYSSLPPLPRKFGKRRRSTTRTVIFQHHEHDIVKQQPSTIVNIS
jgi:hypothetical protein